MNLQERLLQNEIKHLGQIIQTLSFELVVLQDFLKEEHGSKFENFRGKYSSLTEKSFTKRQSSSRSDKALARSSNSDNLEKDAKQPGENEQTDEDVNDDDFRPETPEGESDANNEDLGSDTPMALKDPLDTESNEERKGGRKKTKVWKYFDKIMHKNNKYSARCHLCRSLVSCRASRMVEHLLKCKQKVRDKNDHKSEKKHHVKEACKVVRMDDNLPEEFFEEGSFKDQSNNDSKSAERTGRRMDTIWNYFETVYHNNLKKAKCVSCGQFISPKAVRMRHHKINCKGVQETNGKGEMACVNLEDDDDEMGEFSDEEGFSSSSSEVGKSVNENKKALKRTHHNKDTIWEYFQVVRHNDLKKAKCVSCGQFVSPKAVRMRQHKTGCTGVQNIPATETVD